MKKFVVLILAGLLVLAFGTVFAQEKGPVLEFKASGFMDVISEYTGMLHSQVVRQVPPVEQGR
jgi:hypothetical protein